MQKSHNDVIIVAKDKLSVDFSIKHKSLDQGQKIFSAESVHQNHPQLSKKMSGSSFKPNYSIKSSQHQIEQKPSINSQIQVNLVSSNSLSLQIKNLCNSNPSSNESVDVQKDPKTKLSNFTIKEANQEEEKSIPFEVKRNESDMISKQQKDSIIQAALDAGAISHEQVFKMNNNKNQAEAFKQSSDQPLFCLSKIMSSVKEEEKNEPIKELSDISENEYDSQEKASESKKSYSKKSIKSGPILKSLLQSRQKNMEKV